MDESGSRAAPMVHSSMPFHAKYSPLFVTNHYDAIPVSFDFVIKMLYFSTRFTYVEWVNHGKNYHRIRSKRG